MGSRLDANSSAVRKRIEKHKFDDEEGEEYEGSKFGGFNDYFRRKKIKLQNLDAERRASSATGHPQIFRGIVAHVNGYTQPSLNDLHALIVDYGGGFMQYLDGKTTVTHIIASNLTPKKKVDFRRYRMVKPAWVVESVKAGKLLPWENYRVVDEGVNQQVLGFDNGTVISQVNSQYGGYRDQMDASWYTGQVKAAAQLLDGQGRVDNDTNMPFPSTQVPLANNEEVEDASKESETVEQFESKSLSSPEHLRRSSLQLRKETPLQSIELCNEQRTPQADYFALPKPDSKTDVQEGPQITETLTALEEASSIIPPEMQYDLGTVDTPKSCPEKKTNLTAEEHNAKLLADPRVWKSTVVNPDFLKQYYEESRLHHLSAWKAELKSQIQALAQEKSASQGSLRRPSGARRYILHIDFDSFFAAVSLKKYPQYVDRPAVVAHGGGSGSEIASCNYPARNFGVKNGMWMKTAQQLCPDLKVLPYDFKAYEEASREFYNAAMNTGGIVQSVSVDECLLDVSRLCIETGSHNDKAVAEGSVEREQAKADEIALSVRGRVKEKTGCAVSVGIGGSILLAKIATRKAKPAGQYQIKPDEVLDFIGALSVQELPGVAWSIGGKLEDIGVKLVRDIREITKEKLTTTLGPKTGQKLWDYSRGIDRAEVGEQVVRKSVSAEVNWGIRFVTQDQADEFVQSLCDELHRRLLNEAVKGTQLTLKIMRRSSDSPLDPPKHLGHGKCDTFNKSVVLGVATNSKEILGREALSILHSWNFPPGELRGIGIQLTKLEPLKKLDDVVVQGSQKRLQFTTSALIPLSKYTDDPIDDIDSPKKPKDIPRHPAAAFTATVSSNSTTPALLNTLGTQFVLPTQVDPEVLAELPADIRSRFLPSARPAELTDGKQATNAEISRSNSPPIEGFPTQSQLDQETLNALPADVRAEVLAFYQRSPRKGLGQSILPQSPRKNRSIKPSSKKIITPTKKRSGLLSRGRPAARLDSNSTLTQSNFVASRPNTSNGPDSKQNHEDQEISIEFLEALPEDIRLEVLAQQRRDRLQTRGGIDIMAKKKVQRPGANQAPIIQRRLRLPARAPRPTFTGKHLSSLPDLREAVSSWFEEFKGEEPYEEDVAALVTYLRQVILEERDMAKAVGVVKWLGWVVDDGGGARYWNQAQKVVQDGVQTAVKERGLGRVVF
ncbi:deoxycytidyl transferase [Ptychographa xylographoides]|nr:deoxycytidyl transferase [Ptychographa xylographoides]